MKMFGAIVLILVVAYFADQEYSNGKYTDAVFRLASQIRHSFGV